jgi:hypothetical protein
MQSSGNKVTENLCHVHLWPGSQWTQRIGPSTLVSKLIVLAC